MKRGSLGFLSIVLTILSADAVSPQTTPPAQQREVGFAERVSVEQVLVPVVVRKGNRVIDDLERGDFSLFVDGHRTPIVSFEHSSGAPVHTLILQDQSGSMGGFPKLALSRSILAKLLDQGQPGDLYSTASFAASGLATGPAATGDRATVESWIAGWKPFGRTGLHDAVSQIPELITADSAWRAAVLLTTDGIDNASELSAREARALARQAEVPVHVIALLGQSPQPNDVEAWSSNPLRLLAWVTGGQFHSIEEFATVENTSEEFLRELRSQYILGFPTSGVGQIRPRTIRVEVRGKGRQISFRREYLGTLPKTARQDTAPSD